MNQNFVYWGSPDRSGTGDFTFAAPIQIKGRKEDVCEIIRTKDNRELVSTAMVFVDRELEFNGYLVEGELADYVAVNPQDAVNCYQIMAAGSSPNLSGTIKLLWVKI
jgi:hypothetical protein